MLANRVVQWILISALALAACVPSSAQSAKPMTNQDVIKMTQAKLSEETVLMAIRSAKPGFDTSADGLVKLSTAGVPEGIIKAMIEARSGNGSAASGPASAVTGGTATANAFNPEEVILIDGTKQVPMRYLAPQMRTAARALGWGGFGSYAVLRGTAANLRLKNASPSFIVAVPSNAQPESYITLASFAVRKNGTREVLVGGGYMSYSTGVNKDRVVAVKIEQLPDQNHTPKDFVLYRVNVAGPLKPGEYAFILYNSEVKVVGHFLSGADSYFDFGVDS